MGRRAEALMRRAPLRPRTDRAKPPRTVPAVLGRLAGGSYLLYLMLQQRGASNFLAKWELGWKPRYSSWRDGFSEELAA